MGYGNLEIVHCTFSRDACFQIPANIYAMRKYLSAPYHFRASFFTSSDGMKTPVWLALQIRLHNINV